MTEIIQNPKVSCAASTYLLDLRLFLLFSCLCFFHLPVALPVSVAFLFRLSAAAAAAAAHHTTRTHRDSGVYAFLFSFLFFPVYKALEFTLFALYAKYPT